MKYNDAKLNKIHRRVSAQPSFSTPELFTFAHDTCEVRSVSTGVEKVQPFQRSLPTPPPPFFLDEAFQRNTSHKDSRLTKRPLKLHMAIKVCLNNIDE